MEPFLSFVGGCEFSHLIEELLSDPQKYFRFRCSHSFQDSDEVDAYTYVMENADAIIAEKPDAVIISQVVAFRSIMHSIQHNSASTKEQQDERLSEIVSQCETIIEKLSSLKVPIILQILPTARVNMLNRFKPNPAIYNEPQMFSKYYNATQELAVKYPNFYVMDLSNVCAINGYWNTLSRYDPPWHQHVGSSTGNIAREFMHWINYALRRTKKVKCIICDLDNTMWGGVIRDVGVENLEVRRTTERFRWNVLHILHVRGIMIGFISKNDPYLADDINSFIKEFLGPIKPVCLELSWDDKWQVLKNVQERLNIGMDSIFFIDDNKFERDQMKAMLPEVRVGDENIFEELLYMSELQPEFVTSESKNRSKYYIQEVKRQKASASMSREDFLKQCEYKIKLKRAELFDVNRITELVQRTNQLNTSIKRYTKEDVIAMGSDGEHDIFVAHVSDKFGDYGLVGVCISQYAGETYEIDTLLFSCRIMSRGVENYVLTTVLTYAKQQGFKRAVLRFHKGPKNDGMRKILEKNNFSEFENSDEEVVYGLDMETTQINTLPEWFTVEDQAVIAS